MSNILVRNVMTRFQSRLNKTRLHKHIKGMFLQVGDRKIPPLKEAWVRSDFKDQICLLVDYGLLKIIKESDSPGEFNYIPKQIPQPIHKSVSHKKFSTQVIEEDDFVIISTSNEPFKPEEEIKEEIKETVEVIETKEENKKEEIKEILEEPESIDTKIINEMGKMVEEKDGLTGTGKPNIDRLSERLGFPVSTKTRNRLWKEMGN